MLSLRLQSLIKHIDYKDKIIDIGCDHALLSIYLVQKKIVKHIIVSDVNKNALEHGIENIAASGVEEHIDARLGFGLDVLNDKDHIDTVLISGMGTSTILNILNDNRLVNIQKLIIQSNNDHTKLRKSLSRLGFSIKAEDYFIDNNKHYINIVFIRGKKPYTKRELRYGPILMHNKSYLNFELANCKKIYRLVPKTKIKIRCRILWEMKVLEYLLKK